MSHLLLESRRMLVDLAKLEHRYPQLVHGGV
jgi:hypothetical protein